jgi:hypothetical protein
MVMAKVAGYWTVLVTSHCEFIKYGRDGDTALPYTNESEAVDQGCFLKERNPDWRVFVLMNFDNGCMVTSEIDCPVSLTPDR